MPADPADPADPAVLSAAESATLSAVASRIVPDEDGSPGAVGAGADRYILRSLAAERAGFRAAYRVGLAAVDAAAGTLFGHGFVRLSAGQQDEVLASAMQFFGFHSVIETMWVVDDGANDHDCIDIL